MKSLKNPAGGIALLLAVGVLAACDIPTATPMLEQKWSFPLSGLDVGVAEFLPDGVEVTEGSTAFSITVEGVEFQEDLGSLCADCLPLDGLTVPKPGFQGEFNESFPLPDDVTSAVVDEGTVEVTARNGFGFDPLRPPGGDPGTVTLALRDGGPTGPILHQVVLDGDDTSFGPGSMITRELEYSGPVGSSLSVSLHVDSPAGGPEPGNWVPIRITDEIEVVIDPATVEVSSAVVSVENRVFSLPATDLDVDEIGSDMVDRITSGSLMVEVENPWSVGATLSLLIDGPTLTEPMVYIARVPATPSAVVEVEFSRSDLHTFLGQPDVFIAGQGAVDQGSGSVTVSPGQVMTMETQLDLILLIG